MSEQPKARCFSRLAGPRRASSPSFTHVTHHPGKETRQKACCDLHLEEDEAQRRRVSPSPTARKLHNLCLTLTALRQQLQVCVVFDRIPKIDKTKKQKNKGLRVVSYLMIVENLSSLKRETPPTGPADHRLSPSSSAVQLLDHDGTTSLLLGRELHAPSDSSGPYPIMTHATVL